MQEGFSARLKNAMAAKGFKQSDLIREAAVRGAKLGKSQVSQYVSGKTLPRKDVLELLASILETDHHCFPVKQPPQALKAIFLLKNEQIIKMKPAQIKLWIMRGAIPQWYANSKKSKSSIMFIYDVRGPVLEEAERWETMGASILKLNIGNPAPFGFRTPDEVVFDMSRQLVDSEGYSAAKGLFSARKAIMQYAQIKQIPNVTIDDIYTGNGVSELINLSMLALLDAGDEVLLPSPDYPLWTACVTLAGGTPVHYICDEQAEWYPDIDDIKKKVTPRTKAIVIINPNNPTGALYPREVLEEIVEVARQNNLIIFSDEIYDRLVMDGLEHISIASMAPRSVLRDVQRFVKITHDRRISYRMDGAFGQ